MEEIKTLWIDLFCGAGGTSSGIHSANANAKVIACVNHDLIAIKSHKENHPNCFHFVEDVRDFRVVQRLVKIVEKVRRIYPNCKINLWASLECTNYSNAKGGLPRDADSRTLANALFMYLEALNIDYLYIENVREFMAWGDLDENGKPISRRKGADYIKWVNKVKSYGFYYDHKLLNAADFSAYTSRIRYFGQFAKKGLPVAWPEPTHVKKLPKSEGLFSQEKKPWKPVREVLDLEDDGKSIFGRKKDLSENTHKRFYAGLVKFVANGSEEFLTHFGGGNPNSKVWDIDRPTRTLTSFNHNKVKVVFLQQSNGGNPKSKIWSVDGPNRTVTTSDNQAKVTGVFLNTYYGNGCVFSLDSTCPTLGTKDTASKVDVKFLVNSYSSGGQTSDINKPAPTIMKVPKSNLASCVFKKENGKQWIVDHQFNNKGRSIDDSAPTIIARQDKKPLYLISLTNAQNFAVMVYDTDNPTMVKIKMFMAYYGICDIKMRMLKVSELKKIQGFPDDYILKGTKTNQKKFIGNSVVPIMAQKLIESNYNAINKKSLKSA